MKEGEERIYVVNLRRRFREKPKWRKTHFAVKAVEEFIQKHTKLIPKVSKRLNEYLWERGGKNPPPKVKVKVVAKEGFAHVDLEEK